jgi:hypothetical protein
MDALQYYRDAALFLPLVFAVLLGSSLVAADIENGTAAFTWSIAPSRSRWFVEVASVGLVLLIPVWLPIAMSEVYLSLTLSPVQNSQTSPLGLDPSPWLILFRMLLVYAVVCLVGSQFGRVLPAVLVGMIVGLLALALLESACLAWRGGQVSTIDPTEVGSLPLGTEVATLDGRLVGAAEARSALAMGSAFGQSYQFVPVGLASSKRAEIIAEECGLAGLASTGLFVLTALVIERRRPI